MNIIVIENAFEEWFAEFYRNYLFSLPHTYSEYSVSEDNPAEKYDIAHLVHEFDRTNWMNQELLFKIKNKFNELFGQSLLNQLECARFHTNMHFPGVGGKTYHHDGTDLTVVWCGTDHDGGAFCYIDEEGNEKIIGDKFNQLILFSEPEMKHKAIPPTTNKKGPRITVAAKFLYLNNFK